MADIEIRGLNRLNRKMLGLGQKLKGVEVRVGNNLYYAPLVGSQRFQARVHRRTGWETDAKAVAAELDNITADFQAAVDAALRAPQITTNPLRAPAQRAGFRLQRRMATYPPAPPNSSYRRTGSYGRKWTVRVRETR